jgi:hypothetical protein
VEVNRVRVRSLVEEAHPEAIAFGRANRRARHLPVVGPRRKPHAGCDLYLTIDRENLVLPEHRAVRSRRFPIELRPLVRRKMIEIPGPRIRRRIQADRIDAADRAEKMTVVTGMPFVWNFRDLLAGDRSTPGSKSAEDRSQPGGVQ